MFQRMVNSMVWKTINVPELTYEMFKCYARFHNMTIQEAAKKFLFQVTWDFWIDPSAFGCDLEHEDESV